MYKLTSLEMVGKHGIELNVEGLTQGRLASPWWDCITSAWSAMTDDIWGQIACAIHPHLCMAAALWHCRNMSTSN